MALELMPDGVTFKKLNKTQEKALERYYKRAQDKPLAETVGLPLLAGGGCDYGCNWCYCLYF